MKTKEQLQKEIDDLGLAASEIQHHIERVKKDLSSMPDEAKKQWPQKGDRYEYIDSCGYVLKAEFDNNDHVVEMRKALGNVFRVGTGAKELAYLKFERDVRAKAAELNDGWVADYSDKTQTKFSLINQGDFVCIQESFKHSSPIVRGSECKSREAAHALNDQFGEDKFLAYATGGEL